MSSPDTTVESGSSITPTPAERAMKQTSKTAAETEDQANTEPNAPFPFPTADSHGAPPHIEQPVMQDTSEDALDSGIEESFPASDPVSVSVSNGTPDKACQAGAVTISTAGRLFRCPQ